MICKICNSDQKLVLHSAKEMMLGLREIFEYMECKNCGCLQLIDIPDNLSKYYPSNYYSLNNAPEIHFRGQFKKLIKSLRDSFMITGRGILGLLIQKIFPNYSIELNNFRKANLKKTDKILDVGSGLGIIPYVFYNAGFHNLLGLDPYIDSDIRYNSGLCIQKMDFLNFNEKEWDVIMYNHSFEHLSNPKTHLHKVYDLLNDNGTCIIRIPTVSSFAWESYGVNWVQLDAPRHIFLYSVKSIELLARECGFFIDSISDESTYFQFIGSEQYLRNIPLTDSKFSYFNGNQELFSKSEIKQFKKKAVELNENRQGDSISIILKKYK